MAEVWGVTGLCVTNEWAHCTVLCTIHSILYTMLWQATVGRKYFVETQTIVASFGPSDLSLIFVSGMDLEVTPL